jgi:hypothetical protein
MAYRQGGSAMAKKRMGGGMMAKAKAKPKPKAKRKKK